MKWQSWKFDENKQTNFRNAIDSNWMEKCTTFEDKSCESMAFISRWAVSSMRFDTDPATSPPKNLK